MSARGLICYLPLIVASRAWPFYFLLNRAQERRILRYFRLISHIRPDYRLIIILDCIILRETENLQNSSKINRSTYLNKYFMKLVQKNVRNPELDLISRSDHLPFHTLDISKPKHLAFHRFLLFFLIFSFSSVFIFVTCFFFIFCFFVGFNLFLFLFHWFFFSFSFFLGPLFLF